MAYTTTTTNLKLPQFASTDIPTWDDINTAFATIDNAYGTLESAIDKIPSLTGYVKVDMTNGTGITSAQYSKLTIES